MVGKPYLTGLRKGSPSSWHNRRSVVRGSHFQMTEHQAGSHGRRASRPAGAGPGDQPHRSVAQDDIRHRNCKHGGKPWCVGAPLREGCHIAVVPHRPKNRGGERVHRETTPAEPAGDTPFDEEDEPTQGSCLMHISVRKYGSQVIAMCHHPAFSPRATMPSSATPTNAPPTMAPAMRRGVAPVRTATTVRMTR
jgi:hypothetical protein